MHYLRTHAGQGLGRQAGQVADRRKCRLDQDVSHNPEGRVYRPQPQAGMTKSWNYARNESNVEVSEQQPPYHVTFSHHSRFSCIIFLLAGNQPEIDENVCMTVSRGAPPQARARPPAPPKRQIDR